MSGRDRLAVAIKDKLGWSYVKARHFSMEHIRDAKTRKLEGFPGTLAEAMVELAEESEL